MPKAKRKRERERKGGKVGKAKKGRLLGVLANELKTGGVGAGG